MVNKLKSLLIAAAVAAAFLVMPAPNANAQVAFQAQVNTPVGTFGVGNAPAPYYGPPAPYYAPPYPAYAPYAYPYAYPYPYAVPRVYVGVPYPHYAYHRGYYGHGYAHGGHGYAHGGHGYHRH